MPQQTQVITVGDWVQYLAPDRTPRAALCVAAFVDAPNMDAHLIIFAHESDADLLARESQLRRTSPNTWEATAVQSRIAAKRNIHTWQWPPAVQGADGRDQEKAVKAPKPAPRAQPETVSEPITIDPPRPDVDQMPVAQFKATPPPPLPVAAASE